MLGAVWFSSDSFCDKVASLNPDICVEMEQLVALGGQARVLSPKDCSHFYSQPLDGNNCDQTQTAATQQSCKLSH